MLQWQVPALWVQVLMKPAPALQVVQRRPSQRLRAMEWLVECRGLGFQVALDKIINLKLK
jgi:hypothetical protein